MENKNQFSRSRPSVILVDITNLNEGVLKDVYEEGFTEDLDVIIVKENLIKTERLLPKEVCTLVLGVSSISIHVLVVLFFFLVLRYKVLIE